ncbi:MAG: adenosylmethionine decarboxylase [Pseudomonadota bacterium]
MDTAHLFQLGTDLEAGTTHAEDTRNSRAHLNVVSDRDVLERDVLDQDRDDHFIRRDGAVFAGTHLIIEVVDGEGLDDEARIQQAFRDCVDTCGATLLHIHTHKFSPQGVSGVAVLAESHISVHTWPEIGYGAFDVFMCGDAQPWKAVDVLRGAFNAGDVRVKELRRGEGLVVAEAAGG